MANPSGGTFHYTKQRLNEPGYPGIAYKDGSRAQPASQGLDFGAPVSDVLKHYPLPAFLGAVAVGFLAGFLVSKC
jgi:hypothetical protein